MGFGATSVTGGPCEMPAMQQIADDGLLYNRFHTTALCSPTRVALLTGRNHHSAGIGSVAEVATGAPGNDSVRPNTVATIAEMLRLNGYSTGCVGKAHQTPTWEVSMSGPFDRWPTGEGWRVAAEPTVDIGVLDGAPEYQLFRVRAALTLSDGRIVVSNSGTQQLRLYDPQGRYLVTAGGPGEGPGEFARLGQLLLGHA